MPYDRLRSRLSEGSTPTVVTLPDGSVDRYCTLTAGAVGPLDTRQSLGRAILDERSTFRMRVEATEPGGQAVNVAEGLHALGSDVTCYGHLDDPVFEDLPFETVSMGEPAVVYAFNFADGDVMFAENTPVAGWSLTDLQRVADLADVFAADAVCCSNWASFPGMEAAFHHLGDADIPRVPFVFDPGDVVGSSPEAIDALRNALSALQEAVDVIYNANPHEIRATAATLPDPPADDPGRVEAIRASTGIEGVVMHGRERAIAATDDGRHVVENFQVDHPRRHTGGGDHFTAGLGYALASGWDWDLALACGNACAVRYVETATPPTREDLREFLERRSRTGA